MTKGMFAMSGDPIHIGHEDIIRRRAKKYDEFHVLVGKNPDKKYLFSLEERLNMIKEVLKGIPNVKVSAFSGLTVDHAWEQIIPEVNKSVRNEADIEYEKVLEAAGDTQKLGIKTNLVNANPKLAHISSSIVKALKIEQGYVHELVHPYVNQCLEARLLGQYVIGITGEPGAGKSFISKKLEELGDKRGIPVYNIEMDHIPHRIYDGALQEPRYKLVCKEIIKEFNCGNEDGTINRQKLGEIVFNNPKRLEKLGEIMELPIQVRLKRRMYKKKGLILLNAALIAETDTRYLCNNNVIVVTADKESQEKRMKKRDLTDEQIKRRLQSQFSTQEKITVLTEANYKNIWLHENSEGSDLKEIEKLFDNLVETQDIYGELRFHGMWNRLKADGIPDADYKSLVGSYIGGNRHYHSLTHIVNGLREIEEIKDKLENVDQVLFAWFYHDLVMNRKSKVDEERSGAVAYSVAKKALLSEEFALGVKDLCVSTKHNIALKTNDQKYMVDIDLSIFGQSAEVFDEYEQQIREEYSWVEPEEFNRVRANVLQGFLDRKHIYQTEHFREKYELKARENLKKSIVKLKK